MLTVFVYLIFITSVKSIPSIPNMNDFFNDQRNTFLSFLEEKGSQMEEALTSGYDKAVEMKSSFDNYVERQQNKISEDINGYIENVKEQGRQIADSLTIHPKKQQAAVNHPEPEAALSVPARIARFGYRCETHTLTSNGYVLNLHRIPHSKSSKEISSKTVLLQHGIMVSSGDWILNGPDKALAYALADAGYDVWMSNVRGNLYSKEHTQYKTDSRPYWDFSWHEVALHDIPAVIDYIMDVKGEGTKITYIGHSMGTTILFAMLTLRPQYNQILTAGYALAPVVFMTDIKTPLKSLAPLASNLPYMESLYGSQEFLPKHSVFGKIATPCSLEYVDGNLCKNLIFQIVGENDRQFNATLLPTFLAHFGAGTSWKTVVHYSQEVMAKDRFQFFDFGPWNNNKVYGDVKPLEYDLSKVTLPIKLFWAQNDLLSSEKDVKKLLEHLPPTTEDYLVPDPKFNHLDYMWGINTPHLLNDEILKSLEKSFGDSN